MTPRIPVGCGPLDMGELNIFRIPGYRGIASVDPEEMAEFLLPHENENNRNEKDPTDVKYQDFQIDIDSPTNETFIQCVKDIIKAFTIASGYHIKVTSAWTIINHKDDQIFPHQHCLEDKDWACVYWARVPEGSGDLEFFPLGMPGESIRVTPKAGHFMIFPGDLLHGVRHNTSDGLRISMSLNLELDRNKKLDVENSTAL